MRVDGEPLTGLNRRATYMFQQDALLPWKTVRENVALGLTLGGVAKPEAQARADAWLARVGLAAFAAHYPSQLSGGMRKRVVMAQNWIIDRGILLMDEPFSALDVHTRQRMETELLSLWEGSGSSRTLPEPIAQASVASGFSQTSRKTVVFVTHDLEEAIALADEVVVLSAGPGGARRRAPSGDARASARSDGAAHGAGVRRSLSRDLGGAARGSDQEPATAGQPRG